MIPSWRDLEKRALTDPFVYRMLHLIKHGLSREQALIETVLTLSNARVELLDRNLELLLSIPPGVPIYDLPPGWKHVR